MEEILNARAPWSVFWFLVAVVFLLMMLNKGKHGKWFGLWGPF